MKLVFMGTPQFSVPALKALDQSRHQICAVYSQPPRPSGRGKKLNFSNVHKEALDLGLTVHTPRNFKSEKDQKIFRELLLMVFMHCNKLLLLHLKENQLKLTKIS